MEEILAWIVVVLFVVFGALPALLSNNQTESYMQALKHSFAAIFVCIGLIVFVGVVGWAFTTVLR